MAVPPVAAPQHHGTIVADELLLGADGRCRKVSTPSITSHDLLEAGIAFGWSASTRRANDRTSYLQKSSPRRRTTGTTSARNLAIGDRLEAEGRMSPAGRAALGR